MNPSTLACLFSYLPIVMIAVGGLRDTLSKAEIGFHVLWFLILRIACLWIKKSEVG